MNKQLLFCLHIVLWRIATDVTNQHLHLFAGKNQLLMECAPYIRAINVTIDSFHSNARFAP